MNGIRPALALLLLAWPVPASSQTATGAAAADLIIRNAIIWTGDSTQPRAQALAVRGERLIAVGTNAQIDAHRSPRTRVIDAGGRFITPGFIDDHTHFAQAGALLIGANLLEVHTPAAFVSRIRTAVARMSLGAWLTGGDWGAYEDTSRTRFSPDRSLIDSISPNTPILLNRWNRSAWLANGVTLERAGLSCTTPTPGLECVSGWATGRVSDSALARVRRAITPKTFDQRLREARAALQHLAELGVTTIHDNTSPTQLPVYTELKRRGELTVRVFARPTLDKWNELAYAGISPGFGDDWIRLRALKGFVDGIQGNSTARFYEPQLHSGKRGEWRDSTNTGATDGPGSGMNPPGNMERLLFGLDSAGWWANVHAIGDEAIDTLLDVMEKVIATNGPRSVERRWRIIHSQVIRNAEVAQRYKRLGILAEVQPYHAIDDMRWMEERIGTRARWAYAFKTFHDAGVRLLFGSDWPGTNASWYTANPMTILYAAVTRQTLDGKPEGGWFPQERLDLETSLRAYTVNNAWAEGEEVSKGMLRAGMLADFVVIDRDLFAIPATQLKDAKVLLTVVGGRIVHEEPRESAPVTVWSITFLGDSSDPRFEAMQEAVQYWNRQLEMAGSRLRLGPVATSTQRLPEATLRSLSATVVGRDRARQPTGFNRIDGDVVVALSSSPDITSIGIDPERFGGRGLVILRPPHLPPLSLPNVARNVAAHELGHVLGLRHNDLPGTLMCMPPAPCRPMSFQSDTAVFFPLTDAELRLLRARR